MSNHIATADIGIDATPQRVWAALTDPDQIEKYFFGSRVETDWQVGSPITWNGEYQGKPYQDRGAVLAYDEPNVLSVTHFSPLTGQEDYHTLVYTLTEQDGGTHVSLTQDNCADTDEAEQFSQTWQNLLDGLKDLVEPGSARPPGADAP